MPLSALAVLPASVGSLSSPTLAASLLAAAAVAMLSLFWPAARARRYGDIAVGAIVLCAAAATAACGGATSIDQPASIAAAAVALAGSAAGRTFGRHAAVWAACLVAVVYGAAPPERIHEPAIVAWTGLWMSVAGQRVRGSVSFLATCVAGLAPIALAALVSMGPWCADPGQTAVLGVAILSTLALLPASALAGVLLPGGAARIAGAAALAIAAAAFLGPEPRPTDPAYPSVAVATDEALEVR